MDSKVILAELEKIYKEVDPAVLVAKAKALWDKLQADIAADEAKAKAEIVGFKAWWNKILEGMKFKA